MGVTQGDVDILGAGPAGLQVARFLLRRCSSDVYLYEEHGKIGRPIHCTGLVSLEGLRKEIGVTGKDLVINAFRGAFFFSPSHLKLLVERPTTVAVLVDRERLEEYLYEEVLSLGARVALGRRVDFTDFCSIVKRKNSFGVVAGGARYLDDAKKIFLLPALQYDIKVEDAVGIHDHVFIFLGEKFSHGLFAWAIPMGDDTYKVGVASRGKTLLRMKYLLKALSEVGIVPQRIVRVYGGLVYTGGLVERVVRGGLLYIGDAAGQTKPTTGGGLAYLSLAARILSNAISNGKPYSYEKKVKGVLGPEIKLQFTLRKMLNSMSDSELDDVFRGIKEMGGEELASREGSMDQQAPLIRKISVKYLLGRPSFALKLLFKYFLG
jgi:flavin-dependent dehydrogenase